MHIKRKAVTNFQFTMAKTKKHLDTSVLYRQTWGKDFWITQKALEETSSASPSPKLVLENKIGVFSTNIVNCFVFCQVSQTNLSVPDLI